MSFMRRKKVNKYRSAKKFKKHVGKTKSANMRKSPMRGGYRI